MAHREPMKIGPMITVKGRRCTWIDSKLLTDSFDTMADIEYELGVSDPRRTYTLVVYEYHKGFRYHAKRQVLPLAESMEDAQRMAVIILSLMELSND